MGMILDKHCFAKEKRIHEHIPMKRKENMADRLREEELESLYSCVSQSDASSFYLLILRKSDVSACVLRRPQVITHWIQTQK